jgi:uncharacterized membrane protein YhhN
VNSAAALLFVLTLAVAVADWIAVHAGNRRVEYIAKPLTMVVLIAAALVIDPVDASVRTAFVIGLVFSLLGDVLLMSRRSFFVAGLASFLVGHLAYIVGLQLRGQSGLWFVIGLAVVLVGVVGIGVPIVRAVQDGAEPSLAVPVTAYMVVISVMVASAFGTRNGFAIVGALLFYASDALIAWNRFVHEYPWGRLAIMSTYHIGQIGLVMSLV